MTKDEVIKNVAESIRCVAEHIIAHADDYAQGMEDGQGMTIKAVFELDSIPKVVVERTELPRTWIEGIKDGRCSIWTRYSDVNNLNSDK